jgi:hypothetical protein
MLASSSNVSVDMTVQGPRFRSVNFHPRRSRPESDEGSCRVKAVSGERGATVVLCGFPARNFLSTAVATH